MKTKNLKINDKVKTKGFYAGVYGTVVKIDPGFSIEDHGGIDIKIDKIIDNNKYKFIKIGDIDHFVYFGWEKFLEVI